MGQLHNRGSVRAAVVMIVGGLLLAVLTVGIVERSEAQTPELKCDVGTLIDGQCVEEGEPIQSGPPECLALPELYPVDDTCYMLVDGGEKICPEGTTPDPDGLGCRQPVDEVPTEIPAEPTCPDGSVTTVGGACFVQTPALQADPECLPDARGTAGNCYRISPANRVCDIGVLAGDVCVIEGNPPVNGPSSCPVSTNVFLDGSLCYTPVPLVDGTCPDPLIVDPSGTSCRQVVFERPGPLVCALGFAIVDGRCIRYDAAATAQLCDNDAQLDEFGLCREPVADRVDEFFCLPGGELVNDECVFNFAPVDCAYNETIVTECTLDDFYCPPGFLLNPQGVSGICERTEPASQGDPLCPFGSRGVPNGCYILVAKGPSDSGAPPQCPVGSVEDFNSQCRKPVANAQGSYFCESRFGNLLGRTCFITATAETPCSDLEAVDNTCVRVEPALIAAVDCAVGTAGTAGSCYRYVRPRIPSSWSCPVGQAGFNATCEIEGEITEYELRCPVSAVVLEDGDACYVLQPRSQGADGTLEPCAAPLVPDPNGFSCRRSVDRYLAPAACEQDFVFDGGRCVRFTVPFSPNGPPTCVFSEDESGRCRVLTGDAFGQYYCEDPDATLSFTSCLSLITVLTQACPPGYSPDDSLGGICARFEPAEQGPPTCPVGSRGEPGDCYILVARGPAGDLICEQGELVGTNCVITGEPPTPEPPTCPVSATVQVDEADGFCYTLVPADGEPCVTPLRPDPQEGSCREPVEERPGALECAEPLFGIVDGQCLRYESAVPGPPQCPMGTDLDADGGCRRPVADAAGEYFCTDSNAALNGRSCVLTAGFVFVCNGDVAICGEPTIELVCQELLDGMDCYRLVSRELTCPEPGTPHISSMTCRKPVEMHIPMHCAEGFEQVSDGCLRYSDPTNTGIETRQSYDAGGDPVEDQEFLTFATTEIVYAGCAGGSGSYSVSGPEGLVTGDLVEVSTGIYIGTYAVDAAGTYDVSIVVSCPDGTANEAADQIVFIDPSGVVLDCSGDPVVGAQVTLLRADTADGELVVVADGDASVMDPAVNLRNPTTVDATGRYRWDVRSGFYQVEASVDGQPSVQSEVLEVPPARTDVDLVFSDLNCTATEPTVQPTTEPTVVRSTGPVFDGPDTLLGNSSTAAAVTQPAPQQGQASTPLAVTGTEAGRGAVLGLSLLAAGTVLLGAGWQRRRQLTSSIRV